MDARRTRRPAPPHPLTTAPARVHVRARARVVAESRQSAAYRPESRRNAAVRRESRPGACELAQPAFARVDDDALADLYERLHRFRPVRELGGEGFAGDLGVDAALLGRLVEHWRDRYDWREHENRIGAEPWRQTSSARVPVRAIVRAVPGAPVVVLLHGWPDSVLRFERLLPLLDDVTVVAPALPG